MNYKERLAAEVMAKSTPRPEIAPPRPSGPLIDRMRANIVWAQSGCMEWVGSRNKLGYGLVYFTEDGRRTCTTAHRKFYELTNGPIPDGMQVNHTCDNRRCVNPDHMFLGTQADNIRDMMAKGRDNFRGSKSKGGQPV